MKPGPRAVPVSEWLARVAGAVVAVAILVFVYALRLHFAGHPLVGR